MAISSNVVDLGAFDERGKPFGRLDAEFVDPKVLNLEGRLRADYDGVPLSALEQSKASAFKASSGADGVTKAYVAIDNIDTADGFVFQQDLLQGELPSRAKFDLRPFDILVSNVRPERGAIGIMLPEQVGSIGSSGLSVVRIESERQRNFLFAFLRTEAARAQLIRRSRGSMYPAVTADDVAEIVVPSLPEGVLSAVCASVASSIESRIEFRRLLIEQDAEVRGYLNKNLGVPPPDFVLDVGEVPCVQIAESSSIFHPDINRFDAEFFRAEHVAFHEKLKASANAVRLGEVYRAWSGANVAKGADDLFRLRQAQLTGFGLSYGGLEACEGKVAASSALKVDDVLLACTAHEPHYVGRRVDIVDQLAIEHVGKIVPVPDVMVVRARSALDTQPPPSFLASFLRSPWGRLQVQRLNRGLRGGHVYGQDIEKLVYIPCPEQDWLKSFNERQDSIRSKRKASIDELGKAVAQIESQLKPKSQAAQKS